MVDCRSPNQDGRDRWGSAGVCGDLWGSVGICGDLWGSAGVCGGLRGSAGVSRDLSFPSLVVVVAASLHWKIPSKY